MFAFNHLITGRLNLSVALATAILKILSQDLEVHAPGFKFGGTVLLVKVTVYIHLAAENVGMRTAAHLADKGLVDLYVREHTPREFYTMTVSSVFFHFFSPLD